MIDTLGIAAHVMQYEGQEHTATDEVGLKIGNSATIVATKSSKIGVGRY